MERTTLIRNLLLLAVLAVFSLGTPPAATASPAECFDLSVVGEGCVGCVVGNCWSVTCPDSWAGDCNN